MSKHLPKYLAEFIGSFALIFFACGASTIDGGLGTLGIGLVFGAVIMVMILATGHISGAHFNPAVTIAFALTNRFRWSQVPFYILAQSLGCIAGAFLLSSIVNDPTATLGLTQPVDTVSVNSLCLIEFSITFILMFVISSVATDSRAVGELAAVAIGGCVAISAMVFGPLTGASMNPARSLGPAVATDNYEHLIFYIVAPILGAILGAIFYSKIRCDAETPSNASGCC
ncbi:MAG: aquaporin [Planctomycetes bacterium]|nr:aquaporin [Planctomycetota bacterium]